MLEALGHLDKKLTREVKLLIGGGAAMLLVYDFPVATLDIDALVFRSPFHLRELAPQIHAVARELSIPYDWLNGYFETFLYTLPPDYDKRLKKVYAGKNLKAFALGLEDLLILKCFAGREKDIPHARSIMKRKIDLDLVDRHLQNLIEKKIPKALEAADFFDDLRSELRK